MKRAGRLLGFGATIVGRTLVFIVVVLCEIVKAAGSILAGIAAPADR